MSKIRITVTLDRTLGEELNRLSGEQKKSRSELVEEAIRLWQKCQCERALIEGYKAMAKEDSEVAESRLSAGIETLPRK